MTADDFRALALELEDAIEQSHMGHPDFRANGRIFCTLTADEQTAGVNLTPEEQAELLRDAPDAFTPASGAWGRNGWTMIRLKQANRAAVRGAIVLAWQNVHKKPPVKAKRKTSSAGSPRRRRS